MLKLHGAALSNYYNMAKTALLEKGLAFEEVMAPPSQDPAFLANSPMGKIPALETDQGFLAETDAILEYLEEIQPSPTLFPGDAFQRARIRQISKSLQLYIELVARRGYNVLRGKDVSDEVKDQLRVELPKGIAAARRIVRFDPWIAGDQFSAADLVGYFTFVLANPSAQANVDIDLLEELGAKEWYEAVGARDSVKAALADQAAMMKPKK